MNTSVSKGGVLGEGADAGSRENFRGYRFGPANCVVCLDLAARARAGER